MARRGQRACERELAAYVSDEESTLADCTKGSVRVTLKEERERQGNALRWWVKRSSVSEVRADRKVRSSSDLAELNYMYVPSIEVLRNLSMLHLLSEIGGDIPSHMMVLSQPASNQNMNNHSRSLMGV